MKTYEVTWTSDSPFGLVEKYTTFSTLREAKSWMKSHDNSRGYIYKTWSNGDFECVGVISLSGSNKTFVANSRQKVAGYA